MEDPRSVLEQRTSEASKAQRNTIGFSAIPHPRTNTFVPNCSGYNVSHALSEARRAHRW